MAEIVEQTAQKSKRTKSGLWKRGITPEKVQVVCLRQLGWSIPATAQACSISEHTVWQWSQELKEFFADLPAIQAAKDAIQALIPEAVRVYRLNLGKTFTPQAADIATKILISNKVIADRKVIEDEREQSTGHLVDEAERILAGVANPSAGRSQAQSDTGDTPGA